MLEISGVKKSFGPVHIIRDCSLTVNAGEVLSIVGPSGCGKTTLLRLISGLESADSGEIFLGGEQIDDVRPQDRNAALVFQNFSLYPTKTVRDNIAYPLHIRRLPEGEIAKKLLPLAASLGIEHLLDRYPEQLSGGEKQRVALGRALAREPKVFLADEPLSNLDLALRGNLRTLLNSAYRNLDVPVVHVTHDQDEAFWLSDKTAVMLDGVIQQIGTSKELIERPKSISVAKFIGDPEINIFEPHSFSSIFQNSQVLSFNETDQIGIRPWHFTSERHTEDFLSVKVNIHKQLFLGSHYLQKATPVGLSGYDLVFQSPLPMGVGFAEVTLYVRASDILVFDKNGQNSSG